MPLIYEWIVIFVCVVFEKKIFSDIFMLQIITRTALLWMSDQIASNINKSPHLYFLWYNRQISPFTIICSLH